MSTSRRTFIKTSATVGGALGLGLLPEQGLPQVVAQPTPASTPRQAQRRLRILILGGTGFIGPNQVRYALDRGHTVTLFNRGRTNPGLFPNVEKLQGDRAVGDYASLKGRDWDVVIDNPTTLPRWVRQAAVAVQGHVKQYVFISTISVYAANANPGADESDPVATTNTPDAEANAGALYGPFKALAEKEAEKAFPGRSTILRPGLIVGAGDSSDRFTYWPVRIARGGEVLAPGNPTDPVQFIDARDLAEFSIRVCEDETMGVFNVTGPKTKLSMSEMLGGIRATMSTNAWLTWVDTEFLNAQRVRPWSHMPVWIPPVGQSAGFTSRSIAKAVAAGLTFRPLADTVKATLEFYNAQPEARKAELRSGLPAAREKEVLASWHARGKTP